MGTCLCAMHTDSQNNNNNKMTLTVIDPLLVTSFFIGASARSMADSAKRWPSWRATDSCPCAR
jgi:hypothetical protein